MKSVLISIRPEWVEKIVNGEKTIEVRKSAPKEVPFKAYVYVTKDKPYLYCDMPIKEFYLDNGGYKGGECNGIKLCNGKVIGEFICDKITKFTYDGYGSYSLPLFLQKAICLDGMELYDYLRGKDGYGWHISDLKIYDKPKELSKYYRPCSYSGICYSCNRFRPNGTLNDKPNDFCDEEITRPPQSYMYVEEVVR